MVFSIISRIQLIFDKMSNMMPFIMSSPPPVDDCEEEEDDEFGDFRGADHSFSLTGTEAELSQTNDSPEIEKSWGESATQNQDELSNISSSSNFQSELFNLTASNSLKNTSKKTLGNQIHVQEINGITFETSHRLFGESENSEVEEVTVINDFLLEPQVNKVNINPQSIVNNRKEINEFDKAVPEVAFQLPENKDWETRTRKLDSDKGIISDITESVSETVCDDFSEFADFTSGSSLSKFENLSVKEPENLVVSAIQIQDDFDDFDEFESAEFKLGVVKEEPTVEEILKILFGTPDEVVNEATASTAGLTNCLHSCLDDSSSVWGHLKELETSHALSYQWSNSATNRTFLSSLNVDCRNILFGARWNLCVPRFAANLGVSPLEPVKAIETNSVKLVSSASPAEDLVPAAQFDWPSSGLTNPLDGLEKENATTSAEEPSMSTIVESLRADPVKPIVDDIFGSICDKVVDREEDEAAETMVLHPTVSSVSDSNLRKKDEMSAEAYAIVESFPDLSFLNARKLMHAADENMSRWRLKP